jgi:hypothetical protein
VGLLGERAGLRELVPARLRQSAGHFITNITFRDSWSAGLDGGAIPEFWQNVAASVCERAPLGLLPAGTRSWPGRCPVRPAVIREDVRPLRAPTAQPRSSAVRFDGTVHRDES